MATATKDPSEHRKLALLIGNGNYHRQENRLPTATDHIKELHNLLANMNFDVTTIRDSPKLNMNTTINEFSRKVNHDDLVVVYYFGHGYQVNGKNYLIPVDDKNMEDEQDVEDFGVDLESKLTLLSKQNPTFVNLWILDCCRPYLLQNETKSSAKAGGNGMCPMKAPKGTFLQFSGGVNQAINNDLFTKCLLKNITEENVKLNDVFGRIGDQVYQESNQRQKPFFASGLNPNEKVYLNGSELTTEKFLTDKPLSAEEKTYFEECKEYYHLTNQPLIAVADEILNNDTKITSSSIKLGIDQDCKHFNLQAFMTVLCSGINLNVNDLAVKEIQQGSVILEAELLGKYEPGDKKIYLKMIVQKLTDKIKEEFGRMKMFFMYLGPIKSLLKLQKRREEIRLNPEFNRIYAPGHAYWNGPNNDRKDRGNKPYYCPVGWQRWSFYVTEHFDEKFRGWCIGYHGTKFVHGLSILMSGLKPADIKALGDGVYLTPSVNYAAHPRYSEVKDINVKERKKFFKSGKYMQFVLECRVHPSHITTIGPQTLEASETTIDPNFDNGDIEWVVGTKGQKIVDFNDPNALIVCTGLLTRLTDAHPGLLSQSQWWHNSHLCDNKKCCQLGIKLKTLQEQKQRGVECQILFND